MKRKSPIPVVLLLLAQLAALPAQAAYVNFESSHVHPIALTPDGNRLLAVNTPDAMLEVFSVGVDGGLLHEASIRVGLEPVSVRARGNSEAWVVNRLSDSVSVIDLDARLATATVVVGDEPADVAFAAGRAFVAVGGEDLVRVLDAANPTAAATSVPLFTRSPRALAVSNDGTRVYVVPLLSGNGTTVVSANVIFRNDANLDSGRLTALGLNDLACDGAPPSYPPLPAGIARNPALVDPPSGVPEVGLIVRWNETAGRFEDENGTDWSHCVPYRLPDNDLFSIDAATLAVSSVSRLGTSLFEVSVNPADGKVWIPHTEARNFVRFEHELGVRGHVVDNRVAVVDPAAGHTVQQIDLNAHIDRASDPSTNLSERLASISQPGMMVWNAAGSQAWLSAIGSRKVFRLDGNCSAPACIFGADRAAPDAVEVGGGPSGVVWHEGHERLFVLLRFDHAIAVVDTATLAKLGEVSLHDPMPPALAAGRRFLYDAVGGSGHGDAACSSCHLSGDRDDLAWDLGDPEGDLAPYSDPLDNVRFVIPVGGSPLPCDPAVCASHDGFDPQKGPMTTQTLRAMLEPLHWRGDRATMNDFNAAFVTLMGSADVGSSNGKPAGLSADDMESFRQFTLDVRFPPNPHRNVDDSLPNQPVLVRGSPVAGNPTVGAQLYSSGATDAGQPCVSCHTFPFGAGGGSLGGVTPTEPTSPSAAALFNGDADQAPHSDLKISHLRNMYEKVGPTFGDHVAAPPPARSGFGFTHDGGIPDLATFFSIAVFTLTPQQVADVASFTLHFPSGTRPAVGRQVTLPPGAPPTGSMADEALLTTLQQLGDLASPTRHCELTAYGRLGGRAQALRYEGGVFRPDVAGGATRTTAQLRSEVEGPISFLCATLGSGARLGGDRDEDTVLDGDDCAAADPLSWGFPSEASGLVISGTTPTALVWNDAAATIGPGLRHDVLGGQLAALRASGIESATNCVASGLATPEWNDPRSDPSPGDGYYYLVRDRNACGTGTCGPGRDSLLALVCDP